MNANFLRKQSFWQIKFVITNVLDFVTSIEIIQGQEM